MTTIITNKAALNKAIAEIKRAGENLDQAIQTAGLSCLAYAGKHGQVTPANDLYWAMPKGSRRNALVEWLLAFGKLRVLTKDEQHAAVAAMKQPPANPPVFGYAKDKVTDIDQAMAKPWTEFRPEKAPAEVFDAQAAVQALINRIQKAKARVSKGEKLRIDHADEAMLEVQTLVKLLQS